MNSKWSSIKLGMLAAAMAALMPWSGGAWAQPGSAPGHDGPGLRAARQAEKQAVREERREARQAEREVSADNRRPNRLTPEERRDLRRQINEAGQDLYREPPKK